MKKLSLVGLGFLFLLVFSVVVSAQTDSDFLSLLTNASTENNFAGKSSSKLEIIEANYLTGLASDNFGISTSSAYFLGEMKSEKALFPLMKIFRETKSDGEKLLTAWSLLKIGDSRGVYLVKSEIENGESNDIKCMLEWLYYDHSLKTKGKID